MELIWHLHTKSEEKGKMQISWMGAQLGHQNIKENIWFLILFMFLIDIY